ncbi:MAG: ABC transporter permease subunit [Chloroflexi bacterium]|nr:ABC transporter permease subunit [Chloroflexota bacterium]MYF79447.1 ABC transporter permease subunit [Chloroflexota bacterium]MYK61743.1 ABC transporter permease subunit [Chloroflexota bacterium]
MGIIAETIFILAIRQSISIRRIAVLLLLAAIPLVIAIASGLLDADWDGEATQGFIQGLIFNTGLPLIALIVAAPVFADEIEDRTLTNLMLSPISRWQISIPKMLAAAAIVAIPLAISTFVSVLLVFDEEAYSAAIIAALGIAIGAIAFTSLFAFIGTITTRAVVFGIVYVFGFEALISTAIPGLKYVSISGNTLSVLQELNSTLIDAPTSGSNQLPPIEYAIIALLAVITVSNLATVWRLKQMDVH